MCSAEAMRDIESNPESELYMAAVDVVNCIYQMLPPGARSEYSSLLSVCARDGGVTSIGATSVSPDEEI